MKDPREAEDQFNDMMVALTISHSLVVAMSLGELATRLDESAFDDILTLLEEKLAQAYDRASIFWNALEEDGK